MRVLAIETSCDETGIALVEGTQLNEREWQFTTHKAALLSQALLHSPYGGVYPNLAKREHERNLPALFEQFSGEPFDAVAVTHGPGLEPALWTGIEFAKRLAAERRVPLLPTNHMEGHLISSLGRVRPTGEAPVQPAQHTNKLEFVGMSIQNTKLPVLGLLVSGGHTEFVLMEEWFKYRIIGKTLDDAVGEAFDKVARMLGLPYPGGPEISKAADTHRQLKEKQASEGLRSATGARTEQFSSKKIAYPEKLTFPVSLPRPMLNTNSCDMSFSGLKTAALYALRGIPGKETGRVLTEDEQAAFAAEFEEAVAEVLVSKTRKALAETGARTFVLGGGVAANRYLREQLQKMVADEFPETDFRLPELAITGDNAIMIAQAALARALSNLDDSRREPRAHGTLPLA